MDTVRARLAWRRMLSGTRSRRQTPGQVPGIHVCLIAWYFPPVVTGGTYRPLSLVRHGTELGLTFTVISCPFETTPSAAGRHLAGMVPAETRVIRTDLQELRPAASALPDLDGGALNVLAIWKHARSAFGPDRPDLVFATGPPFHSFVAARLLADHFAVPLVLEYRDEWTECPFDFVQAGRTDRAWERECLAAARLVIFTTESQLEHHLHSFPELDRDRAVVIPNGWESDEPPSDFEAAGGIRESGRLRIAFTGNLGDHTPPEDFLATIAEAVRIEPELAEKLEFFFVGQKSPSAVEQLTRFPHPDMIQMRDQVTSRESRRIQRDADALLLLNSPQLARYLPGKIYDYLASGRPILVFGEGGEIEVLVRRLNAGRVVPAGDVEALVEALGRLGPSRTEDRTEREEWLRHHTRRALALRTVALLEALARNQAKDEMTT